MAIEVSLPTPSGGSAFNDILRSEMLEGGSNYIHWKQRLDMLLGFYGYKDIILINKPPMEPPITQKELTDYPDNLKVYNNWKLANDIAKSFVLAGLNKSLRISCLFEDYKGDFG